MKKMLWLHLLRKKGQRRSGTAVILLPGLVPNSTLFDETTGRLAKAGDLWELVYPNKYVDTNDLLASVTSELKQLRYKKVVLVGVSFGGMLAYLLLRYWRRHRASFEVKGLITVSTPFDPWDVSWQAKTELRFGYGLDKHVRRLFWGLLHLLRFVWRYDPRADHRAYTLENSPRQMTNGIRAGYILRQDRVVQFKFKNLPALLLNTATSVRDQLVSRRNEQSFKKIFTQGTVVRGLDEHANLDCPNRAVRAALNRFLATVA